MPRIFAGFPGRGAIECPAAAIPASPRASKEEQLLELKRFHDQGLISDAVYADRQKAILSEPWLPPRKPRWSCRRYP